MSWTVFDDEPDPSPDDWSLGPIKRVPIGLDSKTGQIVWANASNVTLNIADFSSVDRSTGDSLLRSSRPIRGS